MRPVFLAAAVLACAQLAAPAARAETTTTPPPEDLLLEIQGHFSPTRKWFGMVADLQWDVSPTGAMTPRYETLHSKFVLPHDSAGHKVFMRLPRLASGPHEVWIDRRTNVSVRTEEIGIAPVEAEILRGMVIYRGAVAGGDLMYKLTPTHVDEYIYFRNPPAKLERQFEFDMGSEVTGLRQAGRLIELIGKDGAAHLRLSAPFARDANGTRRNGTVRLEGIRFVEEIDLTGLKAPILVDPDWSTTGTMTVAHWADFAFRLPDSTVMAVAGCALASCPLGLATSACNQVLATTDIWTPSAGSWTAGPPVLTSRYSFPAVVLPNGDALLAGGCIATGCQAVTALAERYSVADKKWVAAGALPKALANATATALSNGDALFPGGCDDKTCFADVARYETATGAWTAVAPMGWPRGYATTTTLADGRVLVVGGCSDATCSAVLANAEVYDPVLDQWKPAGGMSTPRAGHTATLLQDGTVLITGGCAEQPCRDAALNSADVWDPKQGPNGGFTVVGTMIESRHHHTATRLANGQVLLAGGTDSIDATHAAAELYLPIGRHFVKTARMMMSRAYHTGTDLASGDVLVAGGCNPATCLPWAEVFSTEGLPVEMPDGGVMDSGVVDPPDAAPPDYGDALAVTGGPHPKIFRTGALGCSTDEVQDLPCPIAGWPSQDGEFQPNQRTMQVTSDKEVTDPFTGLVWEARDDGKTYSQHGAIDACANRPTGGGSAWRLPTIVELFTINNYGKIGPSTDQAFGDTQQTNYWTSTPVAGAQMLGWTVKFDAGEVVQVLTDTALPIRCVRGTPKYAQAPGHIRLAGPLTGTEHTVRDDANGLEWQRRDDGKRRSWRESLEYCAKLELDGKNDWHLPNVFELDSIVEYGSTEPVKIDPVFQDAKGDIYWTGTFNEGIPTLSLSITFNLGVVDGVTYSGQALARCVRHIQPPQPPPSDCGCIVVGSSDRSGGHAIAVFAAFGLFAALRRRAVRARGRAALLAATMPLALLGCSEEIVVRGGQDCGQDGSCPGGLVCSADWRCREPTAAATCEPACYGETPLCDTTTLRCVSCLSHDDCDAGMLCASWLGRCVPGCSAEHPVCAEDATICDVENGLCRGCLSDTHCTDPARPYCDEDSSVCVACRSDTCGTGAYCGTQDGAPACVPGCKDAAGCEGQGGTAACCGHVCVDVMSDSSNCGGCGLPCPSGQSCCGGSCFDLTSDVENCNACGVSCILPAVTDIQCTVNGCSHGGCESYFADCDNNLSNGCEVNLTQDPNNCYSCGYVCTPFPHSAPACSVSGCTVGACDAGWANCNNGHLDGCEYATSGFANDPWNCGACGVSCGAKTCVNGVCM